MEIREITGDKRRYLPLLLVGDEQEEMVMRYLPHGSLFVCFDPDPCAVAVVTDEGDGCCELKNLAVEPCRQRQGHGRRMVAFVVRRYAEQGYRTLRVGTGETPSTLRFYAQCGFRPAGGETQLHGQRQKNREKGWDRKHSGTFFHNDCSLGAPFAEVPIRYLV